MDSFVTDGLYFPTTEKSTGGAPAPCPDPVKVGTLQPDPPKVGSLVPDPPKVEGEDC